jgi:hypothetical protein
MPTVRGLGALLLITLLGAACAASGASPLARDSQSATGSAPASRAAASESAASASAASAAASGIGLPDGIYTAGHLSGRLTGLVTSALDLPLEAAGSMTAQGSTQLTYQSEHGAQVVTIALAADGPITITFVGSNITAAGISAVGCSITISHADSSGLSGAIDCHALTAINASGSVVGTIDLKGTFDARR